jgi:hypothetical protein
MLERLELQMSGESFSPFSFSSSIYTCRKIFVNVNPLGFDMKLLISGKLGVNPPKFTFSRLGRRCRNSDGNLLDCLITESKKEKSIEHLALGEQY